MTDMEKLLDGIESVARFDEKRFGRRSPFHLNSCGGCGCPSFQQPCPLCRYYPRGSDKGHWSPKVATKEMFCTMVESSGPGGRDGTIATWHALVNLQKYENKENVIEAASHVDVPSAAEYWDAVAEQDIKLGRKPEPRFSWRAWTGIHDMRQLAKGEFFNTPSRQAPAVFAAIDKWVDALHSGDRDEIVESLQKLREMATHLRYEYPNNGNMRSALEHLDEAIEDLNAEAGNAPKA